MTIITKETVNSIAIEVAYEHLVVKNNDVPKFVCGTSKTIFPEVCVECEEDIESYKIYHSFNRIAKEV